MLRLLGFFGEFGYSSELAAGPLGAQVQAFGEPDEAEIVEYLAIVIVKGNQKKLRKQLKSPSPAADSATEPHARERSWPWRDPPHQGVHREQPALPRRPPGRRAQVTPPVPQKR